MTRENKVAMVVGFALVLLVGVLISDHLSAARLQQSADLVGPHEPPIGSALSEQELIDLQDPAPAPVPAAGPPERPIIASPPPVQLPAERFHDVRPGETLSEICHAAYGTAALTASLARFNGLADPDALRSGHRLRIPAARQLDGTRAMVEVIPPPEPPPFATYRIEPGDSLTSIAQRLLNTSTKWRDLYELNRDVIDDPDNIRAGTVIKVRLET